MENFGVSVLQWLASFVSHTLPFLYCGIITEYLHGKDCLWATILYRKFANNRYQLILRSESNLASFIYSWPLPFNYFWPFILQDAWLIFFCLYCHLISYLLWVGLSPINASESGKSAFFFIGWINLEQCQASINTWWPKILLTIKIKNLTGIWLGKILANDV